jgi:biotin transporter BioY
MYIIAIAWMYVVTLMAATEKTVAAGLLTFIFYGLLPCALLLWILGVKHRHYIKNKQPLLKEKMRGQNSTDANQDE